MFFFIFFEGNMFLDYFALGVLIFVFLVIFYGIIILHDIPYLIAKNVIILMPTPFMLLVG
ncbi:inner membrane protein yiaW [Escherichia coli LT-68]|nr:inner membrane protein yiaW [Escherichia coli LT-68]